jgi:hypothetical protein
VAEAASGDLQQASHEHPAGIGDRRSALIDERGVVGPVDAQQVADLAQQLGQLVVQRRREPLEIVRDRHHGRQVAPRLHRHDSCVPLSGPVVR